VVLGLRFAGAPRPLEDPRLFEDEIFGELSKTQLFEIIKDSTALIATHPRGGLQMKCLLRK
jgi:hypothetical protein